MSGETSRALFARAQKRIPGGVNSPARAFARVGGEPFFVARGDGARLFDADGRALVDFVNSWGAAIVGHARAEVLRAVEAALAGGLGFGCPTAIEVEFAETIAAWRPEIEMSRAVTSGTEATMSAIRVARGFTGRDLLIKFAGGYHGHADSLLVAAGSGALTLGAPSSAGVPAGAARDTLVLPYNDAQAAAAAFAEYGDKIAAVIVEPVAGNMNMIAPRADFLPALRAHCDAAGAVLIFDEVMTGFRIASGGAAALFGVRPDLVCLGKVAGGGLPLAVFGGRREVMSALSPLGAVYQAGTLAGNPVCLAAGLATLKIAAQAGFYERLSALSAALTAGLEDAAQAAKIDFCARALGGMFGLHFRATPPDNLAEAEDIDEERFRGFFAGMLRRGFYFAPSPFEAGFVGDAHTPEDIEKTVAAARETFAEIA